MKIAEFTQTPFVSHDNKNMFYIRVEDWDMCNPYEIQIFLDGQLVCYERIFAPCASLLIPCCEKKTVCRKQSAGHSAVYTGYACFPYR